MCSSCAMSTGRDVRTTAASAQHANTAASADARISMGFKVSSSNSGSTGGIAFHLWLQWGLQGQF